MTTKICTKCKEEKDIGMFSKTYHKSRTEERRSDCKGCRNKYRYKKREENKEEYLRQKREWYKKNAEKSIAWSKKWKENNKERMKELNARYREKNREDIYSKNKKRRTENIETYRSYARDYVSKKVKSLSDIYIKELLINNGFDKGMITEDAIECKRKTIQITRLIKNR